MDYVYEIAVMHYLTRLGDTFLCPQFPLKGEKGSIWSTPDFVALNLTEKTIAIVEVSSASDIGNLREKVVNRDKQWISHLRQQLSVLNPSTQDWPIAVRVFVRDVNRPKFENLAGDTKVYAESLESVICNWKWEW